jgi:hypothetical protein
MKRFEAHIIFHAESIDAAIAQLAAHFAELASEQYDPPANHGVTAAEIRLVEVPL